MQNFLSVGEIILKIGLNLHKMMIQISVFLITVCSYTCSH